MFPSEALYNLYMVLIALFTVTAAILSVRSEEDVYSAILLGMVGLGVAAFMAMLGYGILSIFHILVYVGATVTFVVFSVLLIGRSAGMERRLYFPAVLSGVVLGLAYFVSMYSLSTAAVPPVSIDLRQLSEEIFGRHFLSLIFLTFALASVMIEGILIASSRGET